MSTENTSLKNTTPAGDSNTTNEMVIGKINTSQRTLLIVAGSLLALLVLVAVTGTSGGQHLQSSVNDIAEGAGALADYQEDSANFALITDIFGSGANYDDHLDDDSYSWYYANDKAGCTDCIYKDTLLNGGDGCACKSSCDCHGSYMIKSCKNYLEFYGKSC